MRKKFQKLLEISLFLNSKSPSPLLHFNHECNFDLARYRMGRKLSQNYKKNTQLNFVSLRPPASAAIENKFTSTRLPTVKWPEFCSRSRNQPQMRYAAQPLPRPDARKCCCCFMISSERFYIKNEARESFSNNEVLKLLPEGIAWDGCWIMINHDIISGIFFVKY